MRQNSKSLSRIAQFIEHEATGGLLLACAAAFAILLGAVFLREPMTLPQALGAALIFGCAGAGEVLRRRAAGPAA